MSSAEQLTVVGNVDPAGRAAVDRLLRMGVIESAWYGESAVSTNSLALEQSKSQVVDAVPRLVLTDSQTAGRGRRGRNWLSSDQTLTFSLVLAAPEKPLDINMLSLAVGVGIARCLEYEFAPLRASLKWPNDVYVGGGKVSGTLLETASNSSEHLVVGVGLNVGAPPEITDSPGAAPVCSINESTGRNLKRYDCLVSLVEHLLRTLSDRDGVVDDFRSRCLLTGQTISFQEGGTECEGRCVGIDDQGELVVQIDQETRTLRSGDVQLIRQRKIR